MAITMWDIHAVTYGASGYIPEITGQSIGRAVERVLGIGSGDYERQFTSISRNLQSGSFSTKAINTALGIIGAAGAEISASNKLTLFRKAFDEHGTRASGSVHEKIEVEDGIVFPVNVTASHRDDAALNYSFFATDPDGDGTSPITFTPNSALAGTTNADEALRLGPCTINGTAINNIQDVEINFGIQTIINEGDGEIFPKGVAISQMLPFITINTNDNGARTLIGETGLDINNTTKVIVKLRDVDKNSSVSYSTGLSFTVTDGLCQIDNYAGAHADKGLFTITIVPVKVAATDLIVIATF